jgi:hypothetical protein
LGQQRQQKDVASVSGDVLKAEMLADPPQASAGDFTFWCGKDKVVFSYHWKPAS